MAAAASGGERKRWEDVLPRGQRTRALCIGANEYTKMDRLANAIADADGIAQCIDDLPESSAYLVQNPANKRLLKEAVEQFLVQIPTDRPPRIVLIFYAGHAIQEGDKIFLVPVNVDPKTREDLQKMCLSHDDLFRMLKVHVDNKITVGNVLYIVILDACRKALGGANVQTQFSPEIHEPLPEKRPNNWVLCTSTSRGAAAADGEGGHSPFTEALMSAECGMFRQDVPLNWALKMVCQKLLEQGGQEPCFMPPGNIPDSLCLCVSDQRRADDENFDVFLCYRDEGEDRALAERLRDKLTSTYAEQRGLEKRSLRVFLEAGPPPPDRIVQIADAMHNSAVILLLISRSTFEGVDKGVDTLSDARGSPLHQMLWQYEVALELLECGTHHSKHRRLVPLLIGRRGTQSGRPKFEDIDEIADHGEFWPISKMPDFPVQSIREDALFALRCDTQVAKGLEDKMMRCARDTPSILRGRSIRQTVSAFSARDIFKVWTLQGREDHALGDICRRLKDVVDEVYRQSNKRELEGGRLEAGSASKISKVDRHGESESGVLGKRDASKLCEVAEEEGSSSDAKKRRQNLKDTVSAGASHGATRSKIDAAVADPRLAAFDPGLTRVLCAAMFGRSAMLGQGISAGSKDVLVKICARLEEERYESPEDLEDEDYHDDILGHIEQMRSMKPPDKCKFQKMLRVLRLKKQILPRLQHVIWEDALVRVYQLEDKNGKLENDDIERIVRILSIGNTGPAVTSAPEHNNTGVHPAAVQVAKDHPAQARCDGATLHTESAHGKIPSTSTDVAMESAPAQVDAVIRDAPSSRSPSIPDVFVKTCVVQLRLALQMTEVAHNRAMFEDAVRQDVSEALGGRIDKIHVLEIKAGSVIINIGLDDGVCTTDLGKQSAYQAAQRLVMQAKEEKSPLKDERRRYTKSIESLRILHRGLFSSRLQRLADLRSALDSLTSERKILQDDQHLQSLELPHSLCDCLLKSLAPMGSEMRLKDAIQPCSDHCALHAIERSVIRSGGSAIAERRVGNAAEKADAMSLDGYTNGNPFNAPIWAYYVRRLLVLQPKKNTTLPAQPSHMEHRCSECKKSSIFGRMQTCSAAERDDGDKLLCSHHRNRSGLCEICERHLTLGIGGVWLPRATCRRRLCGRRCKTSVLVARKVDQVQSFAPARQSSLKKVEEVKPYCTEEKGVIKHGVWLDRLRKRIAESRELTVFLSSPFQGLLLERAGLVELKGPSLVALCESKGVRLHFVDLRWGITSTMKDNFLTVKTCLDAIRGSDIFVGFYGQRYGASVLDGKSADWLQPSLELCYEDFPWLKDHAPLADVTVSVEGNTTTKMCTQKSVTHLEFEFGYNDEHAGSDGSEDPAGPVVGFAFFRGQQFDDYHMRKDEKEAWKYQAENQESRQRLAQLRCDTRMWAERGRGACFEYGTPEDFVKEASKQLHDVLQQVLPEEKSAQDFAQQNHLRRLRFGYAGWREQEQKIRDYIDGTDSKPLVVTSAPGGGKSALLANAIDQHKGSCLYHFVGANGSSRELENLLDGLLQQVELRLGFAIPFKEYYREPVDDRLEWLAKRLLKMLAANRRDERQKRLVIVIDGVNELVNEAYGDGGKLLPHDLGWLGGLLSGKVQDVRLIISTLGESGQYWSGRCLDVLNEKRAQLVEIGTVSPEHCEAMIQRILNKSRKLVDRSLNLKYELTSLPARANPLYISTFIHEMMSFSGFRVAHGVFEQLEAFIQDLLQAKDAASLHEFVFRRLERAFILPRLAEPYYLGKVLSVSELEMKTRITQVATCSGSFATRKVSLVGCVLCQQKEKHDCPRQQLEPGCVVGFSGETRASIVVRLCSEFEFDVMDHDLECPDLEGKVDGSSSMFLLAPSLPSRVLKFIWASKEGLLIEEILDLLNEELKETFRITSESSRVEQHHVCPLLSALHRMVSKNVGLFNLEHDLVRNAVENRYFAFSSYDAGRRHSGRIRTLKPHLRKVAEKRCSLVHQSMARYFKAKAGQDDMSDLHERLPRAIREMVYHESRYSEKPAVLVAARVRPFVRREREAKQKEPLTVFPKIERRRLCAQNPQTQQSKDFTLDCCLDGEQSQDDVWRRIEGGNLVEKAMDGFNVTIMAYGQTGSGKTHTMFGESSGTIDKQDGLIQRMVTGLLNGLQRKSGDKESGSVLWKMEMSVVEIYNETVRDILPSEGGSVLTSSMATKDLWTHPLISKLDIKTKENAMGAIDSSYTRRVVEATAMNDVSSRSHCIISLHVQQLYSYGDADDDKFQLEARVNLVDLAGSERGRTRKWNANDDREEEAIYINKSLLVLNQVIFKRSEGKQHAPIRESTLTRLLENSLGGNAFTVLMVNLSPSPEDYGETLGSLEYAKRAKRIQNKVVRNAGDVQATVQNAVDVLEVGAGHTSSASAAARSGAGGAEVQEAPVDDFKDVQHVLVQAGREEGTERAEAAKKFCGEYVLAHYQGIPRLSGWYVGLVVDVLPKKEFQIRTATINPRTNREDIEDAPVKAFREIYLLRPFGRESIAALEKSLQPDSSDRPIHATNTTAAWEVLSYVKEGRRAGGLTTVPGEIVWAAYPSTSQRFWPARVVDRSLEVPQDVLSKEKPDSILVHFFDNWDQVSNDTTRWSYKWYHPRKLLPFNETNRHLEDQLKTKPFTDSVRIAKGLLNDLSPQDRLNEPARADSIVDGSEISGDEEATADENEGGGLAEDGHVKCQYCGKIYNGKAKEAHLARHLMGCPSRPRRPSGGSGDRLTAREDGSRSVGSGQGGAAPEAAEDAGEMLPHEILVLKGRSDEQDERLAAGALRPKERSRDNSEEISSAQLAIEAGYRIPPYDVVILNTKGKPVKGDVMQNQRLKDHDQDTRGGGARQAKKNLSVKCVITLLKTANDEFADHLRYCNPVYEETQPVQSKDLSYEFPGIGDAFDLAGTYELTYTMLGADVYDVSGQVKPIEWKQTVVVTPNAPRKVDIDMDQDADTAVLSLGCEKLKWIECAFRDDFGLELGAGGEKTGNLCPTPRKLQLEFEDIKPIGLQLTARLCEKAADGKQHAAWHVKIEPTSKECPALSQLRKRAGERVDGQCTLVFTYKESKKKRGQDDTENRAIKRDKFKFKIEAGTPYELRLAGNKAVTGEQLARREDALVIDNRGKIPSVPIQVVDRWGCLVSKYKDGALKVSEELVYVGDDPLVKARKIGDDSQMRSRKEMGNTLNKFFRDVHETKGRADVGDRVIVLQDPPVSKPEDHRLVCKLVNHKGEALDKECQLKTNSLSVSVTVKPSTFP